MSGKNRGKAKIQMSKPDLPPFLQRMKEQIVANEDADRREQSDKKRKQQALEGPIRGDDNDPTIVKLNDDDLSEEEYKRMKLDLETQYRLDNDGQGKRSKPVDLNIDDLIGVRQKSQPDRGSTSSGPINKSAASKTCASNSSKSNQTQKKSAKKLSYDTSSESESDD